LHILGQRNCSLALLQEHRIDLEEFDIIRLCPPAKGWRVRKSTSVPAAVPPPAMRTRNARCDATRDATCDATRDATRNATRGATTHGGSHRTKQRGGHFIPSWRCLGEL